LPKENQNEKKNQKNAEQNCSAFYFLV